jgi:hypothetical protein
MWAMGKVNLLDNYFNSHLSIPAVIDMFSEQCVIAAKQDVKYCRLASKSLATSDPAADISRRISNIFEDLKMHSFRSEEFQFTESLQLALDLTRNLLMSPWKYPSLARIYLYLEERLDSRSPKSKLALKSKSSVSPSSKNITTVDYRPDDPLIGTYNILLNPAVMCLDTNLHGIENKSAFVDHLLYQTDQDLIAGGLGLSLATCLGWPDLVAYDVERPTMPFPKALRNKILVIGITGDPVTPYHSALNTYNLIGSQNANFLRHEGIGHCTPSSRNNCTQSAIMDYFANGLSLEMKLM